VADPKWPITTYAYDPDAIFVVLIGTNNLGAGELPGPTSNGIIAVLQYLLKHTKGIILYLEILPRGDSEKARALCPPRCDRQGRPVQSFVPAIDRCNDLVHQKMDSLRGFTRVWPVQCGEHFLVQNDFEKTINSSLFSDRLHPNVDGHRILVKCLQKIIAYSS